MKAVIAIGSEVSSGFTSWFFGVYPEDQLPLRTATQFAREPILLVDNIKRVKTWLEGLGYVVEVQANGVIRNAERILDELRKGIMACEETVPLSYKDLTYREVMLLSQEDRKELIARLKQEGG